MSYEIAKILKDAAQIIRERGWVQGMAESDDGKCCLVRAVGIQLNPRTLKPLHENLDDYMSAMSEIRKRLDIEPIRWNDHPDRTQEQVEALLEDTAEALLAALSAP